MSERDRPQSSSSASGQSVDPFEVWRQIYETNEKAWSTVIERAMSSPAFAESSGKMMDAFLAAQKSVRENMRSYLERINVPTREDVARLGELIVGLEEKIDLLDDRLARIEKTLSATKAESPTAAAPTRPRRAKAP